MKEAGFSWSFKNGSLEPCKKKQHNNVKLKNEYVPPIKFTLAQKRNGTISKQIRIVVNVTYIYYIFFLIPDQ